MRKFINVGMTSSTQQMSEDSFPQHQPPRFAPFAAAIFLCMVTFFVTNGGQVTGGRYIVGYLAVSNTVIVTGSNSVLSARDGLNTFNLGWTGRDNQLLITDGGRLNDTIANVGSIAASASNNVVVVSG